ncbi:MAG: hypothetical protein RR359_03595 [Bacilli bacterium]
MLSNLFNNLHLVNLDNGKETKIDSRYEEFLLEPIGFNNNNISIYNSKGIDIKIYLDNIDKELLLIDSKELLNGSYLEFDIGFKINDTMYYLTIANIPKYMLNKFSESEMSSMFNKIISHLTSINYNFSNSEKIDFEKYINRIVWREDL